MEENKSTESKNEGASITFKKSTLWKAGTFIFAILFVITIAHDVFEGTSSTGPTGAAVAPSAPPLPTGGNINVKVDPEDPFLGDKDASVTIVEFSDFQCPFCARAATGAIAELKTNEIADGEVKFVYKDFPLSSIHPNAQKAAEAAQCAHDQNKFWEYHDMLFANQRALAIDDLKGYAADLGLDTNEFNDCLDSGKNKAEVESDLAQATAAGGRGTPYFVVIGPDGKTQVVSGAQPYQNFQAAIQAVS